MTTPPLHSLAVLRSLLREMPDQSADFCVTSPLAAAKHGRKYVGIDLNADYLDLSLRTRLGFEGTA